MTMTLPNFEGLFTANGLVAFVAGMLARRLYCVVKMKYLDRRDPANAPHRERLKTIILAWGIIGVSLVYMGVQTQITHNVTVTQAEQAKQLAAQVAECDREFHSAVESQTALSRQNDDLAAQERQALTDWLALVVNPPQDIFNLHTTDPRYQEWARSVNQQYLDRLQVVEQKREAITAERAKHPLPAPTCGK